jgi:hypothetical protein
MRVTIDEKDINLGYIKASKPMGLVYYGQDIMISIMPKSSKISDMSITCTIKYIMDDPFGLSKNHNRKSTDEFLEALDFIVQRASIAGE